MASRKRSYSTVGGTAKATRMIGDKVLTYRPTVPVSGSYRARLAMPRQQELNFKDTDLAALGITFDTSPQLTLLNGMAQGTTASTRIGRRINIKSIQWQFNCSTSTLTNWTANRYMIVLDTQANAATPAFTEVYDTADPACLRNISNMPRFKVLYDSKQFTMIGNLSTSPGNDGIAKCFDGYLKVNIPVQYNAGTAGTVADIQTNALYFIAVGNSASATTNTDIFNGRVRIRFSD